VLSPLDLVDAEPSHSLLTISKRKEAPPVLSEVLTIFLILRGRDAVKVPFKAVLWFVRIALPPSVFFSLEYTYHANCESGVSFLR